MLDGLGWSGDAVLKRMRNVIATVVVLSAARNGGAQQLVVTVRDTLSQAPAVAAIVTATDQANGTRAYALTNAEGRVTIRLPNPGSWTASVRRIGIVPKAAGAIRVESGATVSVQFAVANLRFSLPRVRVRANAGVCGRAPSGVDRTASLWEQVTLALRTSALVCADSARAPQLSVLEFERDLDLSLTVRNAKLTGSRRGLGRPFLADHPESLTVNGYVRLDADRNLTWFAPDEITMLSDGFIRTHCFDTPKADADPTLAELRFRPVPGRTLPEVAGTAFVDTATGELRRISFRFVNTRELLPSSTTLAGGDVRLERLQNEQWIVSQWTIRMPVLTRVSWSRVARVTGYREVGGETDTAGVHFARVLNNSPESLTPPRMYERRLAPDRWETPPPDSTSVSRTTYVFGRTERNALSFQPVTVPSPGQQRPAADRRSRDTSAVRLARQAAGRSATMVEANAGFAARRRLGVGFFLDSAALAPSGTGSALGLLQQIPGVQLFRVPDGISAPPKDDDIDLSQEWAVDAVVPVVALVSSPRQAGGICLVKLFLDSRRIRAADLDSWSDTDVAALEFYREPRDVPEPFRRSGNRCGTVLLWTYTDADR